MKQAQWILAVLLLTVMVFGITFALNYLGDLGPAKNNPKIADDDRDTTVVLTFGNRQFPPRGVPPYEMEMGQSGFHDFWFANENNKPVTLGLNSKGCKCSEANVFLLSEEWQRRRSALLAGQLTAQAVPLTLGWSGVLSELGLVMGAEEDGTLKKLAAEAQGQALDMQDGVVEVPAGRVGWVRLVWKKSVPGQTPNTILSAEVWMQQRSGITSRLEVGVRFLEPFGILKADREQKVGELNPRNLPVQKTLVCWSSTRSTLDLQTRMVSLRGRPETDPFVVGKPVALTVAECQQLARELDPYEASRVRCAYRIPVTIRDVADDGKTLLDIGPFRRQVEIKLKDEELHEPQTAILQGIIQGDVVVGGTDDTGRIRFNPFPRSDGAKKTVTVRSETPGLKLEVDRVRTAAFLDVHLEPQEKSESGNPVWSLRVEVLPNRVSGRFPWDANPAYQDSAIYLRTSGAPAWTLRIPVEGIANDR